MNIILGNKTKYFGIVVGIFVIFTIIGIAYESTTGLNMLTGERKTSELWVQTNMDSIEIEAE